MGSDVTAAEVKCIGSEAAPATVRFAFGPVRIEASERGNLRSWMAPAAAGVSRGLSAETAGIRDPADLRAGTAFTSMCARRPDADSSATLRASSGVGSSAVVVGGGAGLDGADSVLSEVTAGEGRLTGCRPLVAGAGESVAVVVEESEADSAPGSAQARPAVLITTATPIPSAAARPLTLPIKMARLAGNDLLRCA